MSVNAHSFQMCFTEKYDLIINEIRNGKNSKINRPYALQVIQGCMSLTVSLKW